VRAARQSDVGARCACGAAALKLAGRSRAEGDDRRLRAGLALALLLFLSLTVVPAVALVLPTLSGRVVDDANILDPPTRAALDQKLADLEAKTTDQLVVVTLIAAPYVSHIKREVRERSALAAGNSQTRLGSARTTYLVDRRARR